MQKSHLQIVAQIQSQIYGLNVNFSTLHKDLPDVPFLL